jgi:pre-mRNA-splicing factor SYF2
MPSKYPGWHRWETTLLASVRSIKRISDSVRDNLRTGGHGGYECRHTRLETRLRTRSDDRLDLAPCVREKIMSKSDAQELRRLKLAELKERRIQTEILNRNDVIEEHAQKTLKRNTSPDSSAEQSSSIAASNRRRKEAELLQARRDAEDQGVDFERMQNLQYTAEDVEMWNKRARRKEKGMDRGFADFAEANLRKHHKLIDKLEPNIEAYEESKSLFGDIDGVIYRDASSVEYAQAGSQKNPAKAVDRMVSDLEKQLEKRKKHSRYRGTDTSDEVTYINDKNRRFNEKMARSYDKYTVDIKQSLERGSAL